MQHRIFLLLLISAIINLYSKAATISTQDPGIFHSIIFPHPYISETVATLTISDKSESITGDLATVVTQGFYRVSFIIIITQQPTDGGLISIRFFYTDAESGLETTTPQTDIENINLMFSDTTNKGGLNSSFILNVAAGSQINYSVSYASSPGSEEDTDNAMQYSVYMILEKL